MRFSIGKHPSLAVLAAFAVFACGATATEPPTPPTPTPDAVFANLFYGAINPVTAGFDTPVVVFVPGLGGVASDWWTSNDMYAYAYQAGYRTAFISPNTNNTPATSSISADAAVLESVIPRVAATYNAAKIYFVGHSKGGLDLEEAVLSSNIYPMVKAMFNLSTPNQGTALANWVFQHPTLGAELNLITDAVLDMETTNMATFRAAVDPIFELSLAKPFYTWGGTGFLDSAGTIVTGGILDSIIPIVDTNTQNDGLVTVGESQLNQLISNDMGTVPVDHFKVNQGNVSFPKISGRIQGIETTTNEFQRISVNGFSNLGGNPYSTMIWSAKWFNGKLYVGTGSQEECLTLLTADVRTGTQSYPSAMKSDICPDQVTLAQNLAAEIWQYTPSTSKWVRVYQSPTTVPVTVNGQTFNTALDVGYRGMEVFTESDGTQALYVGTVTSGSAFQPAPFQANGWPGPRLLRTTDGVTWTAVPQDSGTFLGNLGNFYLNPTSLVRSYRSLKSFNGQLFATIGTYEGSGVVIASSNPSAGDNAWQQVSPSWSVLPVWDTAVFNNQLYVTTGFTIEENSTLPGYGVYSTPATGTPPYTFTPIVINGGYQSNQSYRSPNGLATFVFRNELYVSTDRPTELIRIRPDGTWDLIVGATRTLPSGSLGCPSGCVKAPLSGMGNGFDNGMTGHFWRLGSITAASADQNATGQNLFLGTWDWSDSLQVFGAALNSFDAAYTHQYGTDVYRSEDGVHFTAVTQTGFGDPYNEGTRTIEGTPAGLFLGTARLKYGAEMFWRIAASTTALAAPRRLTAQSSSVSGQTVNLAWDPSPGAAVFNIYRATVPSNGLSGSVKLPANGTFKTFSTSDIQGGSANYLCNSPNSSPSLCSMINGIKASTSSIPGSFPLQYALIAQTTGNTYTETAPSTQQSLYYVRAVDSNGHLSDISNVVGAPSASTPVAALVCDIDGDGFVDTNDISLISEAIGTPVFGASDPRDANKDGQITSADVTFCRPKCNNTGCALQ